MKTRKAVKTAVSIPEPLFAEGEKFAKRLRLKRSQLYARAPFLPAILPRLQEVLERPWRRLVDLDLAIAAWLRPWISRMTKTSR